MKPLRLLLVDDEETVVFALERYFIRRGFEVDHAGDLDEAESRLATAQYDVVIADLRLTGVQGAEGLEIIAYVRKHCPATRTVLLTAYGTPEVEAEARRRGADVVMRKPKPLHDLAQVVLGLVESRK